MKITHGTAMYTGGGCYSIIGELNDGNYFVGCQDWIEIVDADPREKDEEYDWVFFNNNWMDRHVIEVKKTKEFYKPFKDFCEDIDNQRHGLITGWEDLCNFCAGEVTEMIDFDGFYKEIEEENAMENYKEVTPETFEREYKRVVKKFLDGGEPSDSPANQDTYIYWNGMKCNIGSGADMYSYMIDGLAKRIRDDEWVMTPISATDIADTIVEMIKNNSNIECDTDDTLMLTGVEDVWHDENVVHLKMKDGTEFTIGVCKQ